MAKKKEAKLDLTPTTLVTTDILSPYREGEVFTVPKYQADRLLQEGRENEDGVIQPVKVRLWDRKNADDVALLESQMGKTLAQLDAQSAEVAPATDSNEVAKLKAQLADAEKAREDAEAAKAAAEEAQAAAEEVAAKAAKDAADKAPKA